MPKVKRTVTEESEVQAPLPEGSPVPTEDNLWDHMAGLTPGEWQTHEFYVYQHQPPVTKKEGESAYRKKYGEPFTQDDLHAILPQASVIRIIEKIRGERGDKKTWYIAFVPENPEAAARTVAARGSETAEILKATQEAMKASSAITNEAMTAGLGVLAEAQKRSIEMMPKQGSLASELADLKNAGLLNTGGAFDFDKLKGLITFVLPMLKDMGILRAPADPAKAQFSDLTAMFKFVRTLGIEPGEGLDAAEKASPWISVFQSVGPGIFKSIENVTGNIARMLEIRFALAGGRLPQSVSPPANAQVTVQASPVSPEPTPATGPASPPTPSAAGVPPQQITTLEDWLKNQILRFYVENMAPRRVARWLRMTVPEMAVTLEKAPEPMVEQFWASDPILSKIDGAEKGKAWRASVIAQLKGEKGEEKESAAAKA
jgi:hypothetical protein